MTQLSGSGLREQVLNFLSLSRDVARNQHDAEFADEGGQIIYCFDSTIFNLFFNTMKWRHAVSSFYGREWAGTHQAGEGSKAHWNRIEAQSALIASEHLLSEDLPGAKNRNIYLTPWHRVELAVRLKEVVDEYDLGNIDTDKIEQEIRDKLSFLTLSRRMRLEEDDPPAFRRDAVLEEDLVSLRGFIHQDSSLVRYELTRRAAAMLVECEVSERLDQVHRLLSRPLAQRITPLHQLFRPTHEENASIARDAQKWFLRILSEMEPDQRSRRRKMPAIWNDAQSIAYVRWTATKTRPDQRVVLVTSDDLIFDAYRRWWSDQGITQTGDPEDFVLRRSFQYTPIFNLRDSRNDLSRVESMHNEITKLFKQISEAIQLTLLPFNLARVEEGDRQIGALAHNRHIEYMALKAKDYRDGEPDPVMDYFMQRLDDATQKRQSAAIRDIAGLWRDIERIGIGFFYDQVVKRLEDDQYLFGIDDNFENDAQSTEEALRYLSHALQAITDRTRTTYLPIAASFLRDEPDAQWGVSNRAPDLLWYQLPTRQSVYEIMTGWRELGVRDRGKIIAEFSRVPEAPFVLAAAFALAKQDWWKAEEFSDYALTACRTYEPSPLNHAEVLFLSAFAKRFRLGSSTIFDSERIVGGRGQAARGSLRRAIDLYESAETLLEQYLEILKGRKASHETMLYILRGKSERAALRLFMALHLNFAGIDQHGPNPIEPLEIVAKAQAEILECMRMDKSVPRELRDKQTSARDQFLHNGAASEVVRFVIAGEDAFKPNAAIFAVADAFEGEDYRRIEEQQPLMRSERIAFQVLHGAADPLEWSDLEVALADATQTGLTIDRLFARALLSKRNELFDRLSG